MFSGLGLNDFGLGLGPPRLTPQEWGKKLDVHIAKIR
jgi:hypothetical protein